MNFESIHADVCRWAEAHGLSVRQARLEAKKAGDFDGLSVTMNASYTAEERTYHLVHALGSIVRWSMSYVQVRELFQELRDAKSTPDNAIRVESAIDRYRAFEIESSEFAVWLLGERGKSDVVPTYTNFMRADLKP
jgi:hypothetical protein